MGRFNRFFIGGNSSWRLNSGDRPPTQARRLPISVSSIAFSHRLTGERTSEMERHGLFLNRPTKKSVIRWIAPHQHCPGEALIEVKCADISTIKRQSWKIDQQFSLVSLQNRLAILFNSAWQHECFSNDEHDWSGESKSCDRNARYVTRIISKKLRNENIHQTIKQFQLLFVAQNSHYLCWIASINSEKPRMGALWQMGRCTGVSPFRILSRSIWQASEKGVASTNRKGACVPELANDCSLTKKNSSIGKGQIRRNATCLFIYC